MSSNGISFGGLASGLDTQAIISALLAVERRPIFALEDKQSSFRSQRNLFGQFESLLEGLRDGLDNLRKTDKFLGFKAEVDDDTYLSATAGTGATPGSYDISVLGLARAQVSASEGVADKDITKYGSGTGSLNTLKISIDGITTDIEIDDSNNTLEGIAGAINAAGIDVQASVLDTGDPDNPYKLVMASKRTGAAGAFSVSYDPASSADFKGLIDGVSEQVEASDAHIQINGIDVFRTDNVISDAIEGVTLDLKGLHADPDVDSPPYPVTKLTISADATITGEKVAEFVEAYNAVVDFVESQNQVNEDGQASGALFGDSTLRSIRSTLRNITGGSADTGNDEFSLLAQVGITADQQGKLELDQSKFEQALNNDEDAVRTLFSGELSGIATRLHGEVDNYLDSVDGLIKTRRDGFDRRIKDIDGQIERAESRLERYELSLVTRFANLESLLSQLQSQGSALSGFPSLNRNS